MSEPQPMPSVAPRRVLWMELFFDLIFVSFITQLAHGLHGNPGLPEFAIFAGLFVPTWWAWINMTVSINVASFLSVRTVSLVLLIGTLFVGVMAAAAPEGVGSHAWAFALGNAGLRLAYLPIWFLHARRQKYTVWRPLTYSAATALIWIASIWVPQPAQYFLWAATIVIEIALLGIRRADGLRLLMDQMALDHLAERMGLFTLIVLGESLIVTVTGVSDQWTAIVGATAVLGFVLIGSIAWTFLIQTTVAIEHGLRGLRERRDARGMRDTVMYLPYFLVVGITLLSTGLGTAVSHPEHPLPIGAAVALGGGLGLYYVTNLVVGMRYGQLTVGALVWTLASAAVALLLIPVSSLISAIVAVAWAAVIVVANVVFANVKRAALSGL